MPRKYTHEEEGLWIEVAIRARKRDPDQWNRQIAVDDWTPDFSALDVKPFVDRIPQRHESDQLERAALRERISRAYARAENSPRILRPHRDPLTGQEIVPCDPNCTYSGCIAAREVVQKLMGRPNTYCSGCLECTLMEDGT